MASSPSQAFSQLSATDNSIQVIGGSGYTTIHVDGTRNEQQSRIEAEQRRLEEECRHSLSFQAIDARKNDIIRAHRKTCEWILKTAKFQSWMSMENLSSTNGILWIKGKPGAGKSTLMKFIFRELEKPAQPPIALASYFFHARGLLLEKSPLGMYRSLIFHLCQQSPAVWERLLAIYQEKRTKHSVNKVQWQAGELHEFLLSAMEMQHPTPIVLLIDALDECRDATVRDVASFLEDLTNEAIENKVSLRICLSSRHYPYIMIKSSELVIDDLDEHTQDISLYVGAKLHTSDMNIKNLLLQKASGIFMWAVLVTKILNQLYDEGRVEAMTRKLEEIPRDLDALFWDILDNEDQSHLNETVLMLRWILFATRPLTPEQLYVAVRFGVNPNSSQFQGSAIEPKINIMQFTRFVISCSKGLAEIRQGKQATVQFIHESINDFLLRKDRLQQLDTEYTLDQPLVGQGHSRLASICVSYIRMAKARILSMNGKLYSKFWETVTARTFLWYAIECWMIHMELAQADGVNQHTSLNTVGENIQVFRKGFEIAYPKKFPWTASGTILFWAVAFKHRALSAYILGQSKKEQGLLSARHPYTAKDLHCAALIRAMEDGDLDFVQLLLDHGADASAQYSATQTVLHRALEGVIFPFMGEKSGNLEIARLLLDFGAEVNAEFGGFDSLLRDAIHYHAINAIRLLLEYGLDLKSQHGVYGITYLQAAVAHHDIPIIRLLLDHGADINISVAFSGTALQLAVVNNHLDVVHLLLDRGADVNVSGGQHGSALKAACATENFAMVKILIEKGAVIDDPDHHLIKMALS